MIENFCDFIYDKSKNYIIFDVGSRDCIQSIEFYTMFPNARIFAFECNPNTIPICRKNIEPYKDRITLIEKAVADRDGEISFYPIDQSKSITSWKDGNPGASSLFKLTSNYNEETLFQTEVTVPCCRLETFMKEAGLETIDILWMDLQGAELMALKSLGPFFRTVKYIYTEISHTELYKGQVLFSELDSFCRKEGFIRKTVVYSSGKQEDVIYQRDTLSDNPNLYDIIIPVGPNDLGIISQQIEFTKCNILFYRNIYIISSDPTLQLDGCTMILETTLPLTKEIVETFHGSRRRNGWYYQQLLKLYASKFIPDLLENYLVIDSDTFFIKPTVFIEDGKPCYSIRRDFHSPYFTHMKSLHPSLEQITNASGIAHHMLFQKSFVTELIKKVEEYHNLPFYEVFLKNVILDTKNQEESGASEYEIYFNFILKNHRDEILVRPLTNIELPYTPDIKACIYSLYFYDECDYVNFHWYMRN